MNSLTSAKLKNYMVSVGSNHFVTARLKQILNANFSITVSTLRINNQFDESTQKAVAYFQKSRGLPPTGAMNFRTWLAIGAEMNPIQIKNIASQDKILEDLLGTGYVLAHPYKTLASRRSVSNAVIHTKSSNPFTSSEAFNFTFRVFVNAFAPFEWFGPFNASRGDNLNGVYRSYGTKAAASYRLQCYSTITARPIESTYDIYRRYEPTKTRVSPPTDSYLWRVLDETTEKSEGYLRLEESLNDFELPLSEEITNSRDHLKYHLSGNDDAFALWGDNSLLTSDIDVHPNINFKYTQDKSNPKKIYMQAYGNVIGDQFPAVEAFIVDRNDNGVMLGVWQVCEGDGPVFLNNGTFGIIGDKRLPMFDIDITVIVENGIFTGVLKNGKVISITEHNQYYINLPPVKSRYSPSDPKPVPRPTPTPIR